MVGLHGNLLAAVDLETTGERPGYHEIVQIGVVTVTAAGGPGAAFESLIRPLYPWRQDPQAARVHGLTLRQLERAADPQLVADTLSEWHERLNLPIGKRLVPLAHNWAFESSFLSAWLGVDLLRDLFHPHARDSMLLALSIRDGALLRGLPDPFPKGVGLGALCRQFGITNRKPHDALEDAVASIAVYRRLLGIMHQTASLRDSSLPISR